MSRARAAGLVILALLPAGALLAPAAEACTTFCLRDGGTIVFGKNYDWQVAGGMLVVNKRGVAKEAMPSGEGAPARWTSRHGSVTFNQYGREFPSGGINEAGLVVELMWLDGSRYPDPDRRGALGCLQWIQYQLDTAASVEEVLASDAQVRIASPTPLHYLVADASGRVAAVEFLRGRLAARTGKSLPVAALANHAYGDSLDYLAGEACGGSCPPAGASSLARFSRAAAGVRAFRAAGTEADLARAFGLLDDVAQAGSTQWSIVYEIDRRRVHYRTARNRTVRSLGLEGLDFRCATPVQTVDLHEGGGGDVRSRLRPYRPAANLDLVRSSFRETGFLVDTPEHTIREHAGYPDTTTCRR